VHGGLREGRVALRGGTLKGYGFTSDLGFGIASLLALDFELVDILGGHGGRIEIPSARIAAAEFHLDPGRLEQINQSRIYSALAVQIGGERPEVFLDVVEVDALGGALEAVGGELPYPDGAVGEDQDALGLEQSAPESLGVDLEPQGIQAFPRGDIPAFGDDGPSRRGRSPLVQPEYRAGVDPVPALGFLALRQELRRLAPCPRPPEAPTPRARTASPTYPFQS
jgi:hypothetical protein